MNVEQLLNYCGNSKNLAAECAKVDVRTVEYWMKTGRIPEGRQALVQIRTGNKLVADGIGRWRE